MKRLYDLSWLGLLVGMWCLGMLVAQWQPPSKAIAQPSAPGTFCKEFPNSPLCAGGGIDCTVCHTIPPALNAYGKQLKASLLPGQKRPLKHDDFTRGLKDALAAIGDKDADGDGVSNNDEILAGYLPGDKNSKPSTIKDPCANGAKQCKYNHRYAFKKASLDFCGKSPTYEQLEAFDKADDKTDEIRNLLKKCMDSEFWLGKDGVLWKIAHKKIRPLQAIKAGKNEGPIPLGDYYDDYNLFVYSQIDNHDARDILTAKYFVDRTDATDKTGTTYSVRPANKRNSGAARQMVSKDKRSGILTTRWTLVFFTMFSVLPRATAAQMYRAYLGLDIAKMEGLYTVKNEPADYDNRNVRIAACAGCHTTLDAMTYPFSRYNGLSIQAGPLAGYSATRMKSFARVEGSRVGYVPEAGFLLGQRVKNLVEWGKVAAASDDFAKATVKEYWTLLIGELPKTGKDKETFEKLWKDFKTIHNYSVERMLTALVQTEAYGVR